ASQVRIHDVNSVTFRTPNAADFLLVNSPQAGRNAISGSSGGQIFVPLVFYNDASVLVDAATNDGAAGIDAVTINSALVAAGLKNLTVNTGAGDDQLALFTSNFSLPVPGGAFTYNAGSNSSPAGDAVLVQADVDWTLTDASLQSSGGGVVVLNGVESAGLS